MIPIKEKGPKNLPISAKITIFAAKLGSKLADRIEYGVYISHSVCRKVWYL